MIKISLDVESVWDIILLHIFSNIKKDKNLSEGQFTQGKLCCEKIYTHYKLYLLESFTIQKLWLYLVESYVQYRVIFD